jgi:ribosomal protein L11 methyltransferase
MNLEEIKVEIAPQGADAADQLFLERELSSWNVYEDVIAKRVWLQGLFPNQPEAKQAWNELESLLAAAGIVCLSKPEQRGVADQDWKDSYKAHFKAWKFGRLHWVPEWERGTFVIPPGDVVLWLDPGLAFGTGNHETTRLCCERLVNLAGSKKDLSALKVIDAGCGSGILALSAVLLGAGHVEGFDNDPEAVRISGENARLNCLAGKADFFVGDLLSGLRGKKADLLMANILADVLMNFSAQLLAAVAPGGSLVLSGILAQERDKVRDHFAAKAGKGWRIDSRLMGEWADVVLTRI